MSTVNNEFHDAIVGIWQKHLEILQQDRQDLMKMGQEMNLIVTEESGIKLPELRGSIFRIKEKEGNQKSNEKLQQFLE